MAIFSAYRLSGNVSSIEEKTERFNKNLLTAMENAMKTLKARSPETIEKQNAYHKEVFDDTLKLNELEKSLDTIYNNLLTAMLEDAKQMSAEEVLEKYKESLAKFSELNNEYRTIRKKKRTLMKASKYDNIIKELSLINPEFMLHCDPTTLTSEYKIVINKMNNEQLEKFKTMLEKADMFKKLDEPFMKMVIKFFPDYIKQMDLNDMIFALKRNPSAFKKFGSHYPFVFETNPSVLKTIANTTPEILLYIPKILLDTLADNYAPTIGGAIVKCPNVLENFYPDFFRNHSPKFIFSQHKKPEAINAVKDYADKFPDLKAYYGLEDNTTSV